MLLRFEGAQTACLFPVLGMSIVGSHTSIVCQTEEQWPFTGVVTRYREWIIDALRAKDTARCSPCRRLEARVDALEAELAALQEVVARLSQHLAAARKDSSTSSTPPSSALVKPPPPPSPQGQDRRQAGGQPGHPKHEHAAFPPASVHGGCFDHRLDSGAWCGQDLRPALTIAPRLVQQVDLPEGPLSIQGPRRPPGGGPPGPKRDEAPLPPGIERGGLVGPSLTPGSASLKGSCPASFWTVPTFLRDVVGVTIWRGERARLSSASSAGRGSVPTRNCGRISRLRRG